jgi:hypothetical protein
MQKTIQIGSRIFSLTNAADVMDAAKFLANINDDAEDLIPGCSLEEMVALSIVLVHIRFSRSGTGSDYVISARDILIEGESIGPWASKALAAVAYGSLLSMFAEAISETFQTQIETFKGGDELLRLRVRLF